MSMKKLTGFAVVNCEVGKKIAYTYSEIDENGNITKSNIKESYAVINESLITAINEIEKNISDRLEEL